MSVYFDPLTDIICKHHGCIIIILHDNCSGYKVLNLQNLMQTIISNTSILLTCAPDFLF